MGTNSTAARTPALYMAEWSLISAPHMVGHLRTARSDPEAQIKAYTLTLLDVAPKCKHKRLEQMQNNDQFKFG